MRFKSVFKSVPRGSQHINESNYHFEDKHLGHVVDPVFVALTGSTGNFGAYVLDLLLRNDRHVKKVCCLNRSENVRERQIKAHEDRALLTHFPRRVVEFVKIVSVLKKGVWMRALSTYLSER